MLKAVTRSARQVDDRVAAVNAERAAHNKAPVTIAGFFDHHATPADLEVQVEEQDFELARKELVPSVSHEELKHYERVRDQFQGGPKDEQAQSDAAATAQANEQDKGFAREKFNELMARRTSSKNKVPQVNGGGEGVASSADDDDDFVIRTDKLTINGGGGGVGSGGGRSSSRVGSGKGKGKSKSREEAVADGVDGEGEDLYD